jgi:polyferredoxin
MVLALVWGVGLPAVALGWLVVGRAFCSACPMGALSERVGRLYCAGVKMPQFLKKYGFYFSAVGLAVIMLTEISVQIHDSPRATALLLLTITLCAATSGLLFQRRAWCRHICPFGRWSGVMASLALTELRPNRSVCNNDCTTHSCYVGEGNQPGCPMYEGTFAMQSNQNCIMCGNCIKLCKSCSPRLNLRQPAQELVAAQVPDRAMSIFILFLIGTQLFRGLKMQGLLPWFRANYTYAWIEEALIMTGMIAVSFLFMNVLGAVAFRGLNKSECREREILCYGLLPSVFSFELAYQLHFFLEKGVGLVPVIGRQIGINLHMFAVSVSSGWTVLLQIIILLFGAFASLLLMKKLLQKHGFDKGLEPGWRQRLPVLIITAAYFLFLWP